MSSLLNALLLNESTMYCRNLGTFEEIGLYGSLRGRGGGCVRFNTAGDLTVVGEDTELTYISRILLGIGIGYDGGRIVTSMHAALLK